MSYEKGFKYPGDCMTFNDNNNHGVELIGFTRQVNIGTEFSIDGLMELKDIDPKQDNFSKIKDIHVFDE